MNRISTALRKREKLTFKHTQDILDSEIHTPDILDSDIQERISYGDLMSSC